eukprot:m.19882 g.19882  ORF g.19882 m.19882 type:complete len:150 (+) comp11963_c0_seq1:265-714(+)
MFCTTRLQVAVACLVVVGMSCAYASDNVHPEHMHAHDIPEGSYKDSCSGCTLLEEDTVLKCISCYRHISDAEHSTENSQITIADCEGKNIRNRHGKLECGEASGDEGFLYLEEVSNFQAHGSNHGVCASFDCVYLIESEQLCKSCEKIT